MKTPLLRAFVAAVGIAGVAGTVLLATQGLERDFFSLLLLLGLAAVAGSRSVRIPVLRVEITAADMFTFCALATLAPVATPLVAFAGVAGAAIGSPRRSALFRTVFNLTAITLSGVVAALVFTNLGGGDVAAPVRTIPSLFAAVGAFLAVNLGLVGVAIRLERAGSALATLRSATPVALVAATTSLLIACALALAMREVGPVAVALGLVATGPLVAYFQTHKHRLQTE